MPTLFRSPACVTIATALAVLPAHQEADTAPEVIQCVASWGPVESSVYPRVRAHADVKKAIGSGPTTEIAEHAVDSLRAILRTGEAAEQDATGESTDLDRDLVRDLVWDLDVSLVLPFLQQLHPGVTGRLRHARLPADLQEIMRAQGDGTVHWVPRAVEGGRATWLRRTDTELELLLRVHVEFELVPDEMYLLPAQFEGRLIWDRASDRPRGFHLALPPRNTNYDLNHRGSVDIGYLPLMQVATKAMEAAGPQADAARARLRSSFYRSERIEWRSLADALERAKKNGRRLHVLQLFGTLDDESY